MTIVIDEFHQNDLEKETNDSHRTFYQNAIHYKERENVVIKNYKCGLFSFVHVIKPGARMNEIFSVGLQKTDKDLKA